MSCTCPAVLTPQTRYLGPLINFVESLKMFVFMFFMKEEYYYMMLMSTYGKNERVGKDKFRTIGRERIPSNYLENFHTHHQQRDAVVSHDASYKETFSLEEIWYIERLGKSCFSLYVGYIGGECYLGEHHFGGVKSIMPILEFGRLLSRDLIKNPYHRKDDITPEGRKINSMSQNDGHILIKLSTGKKSMGTKSSDKNKNNPLTHSYVGFNE